MANPRSCRLWARSARAVVYRVRPSFTTWIWWWWGVVFYWVVVMNYPQRHQRAVACQVSEEEGPFAASGVSWSLLGSLGLRYEEDHTVDRLGPSIDLSLREDWIPKVPHRDAKCLGCVSVLPTPSTRNHKYVAIHYRQMQVLGTLFGYWRWWGNPIEVKMEGWSPSYISRGYNPHDGFQIVGGQSGFWRVYR